MQGGQLMKTKLIMLLVLGIFSAHPVRCMQEKVAAVALLAAPILMFGYDKFQNKIREKQVLRGDANYEQDYVAWMSALKLNDVEAAIKIFNGNYYGSFTQQMADTLLPKLDLKQLQDSAVYHLIICKSGRGQRAGLDALEEYSFIEDRDQFQRNITSWIDHFVNTNDNVLYAHSRELDLLREIRKERELLDLKKEISILQSEKTLLGLNTVELESVKQARNNALAQARLQNVVSFNDQVRAQNQLLVVQEQLEALKEKKQQLQDQVRLQNRTHLKGQIKFQTTQQTLSTVTRERDFAQGEYQNKVRTIKDLEIQIEELQEKYDSIQEELNRLHGNNNNNQGIHSLGNSRRKTAKE